MLVSLNDGIGKSAVHLLTRPVQLFPVQVGAVLKDAPYPLPMNLGAP